MNEDLVGKQYLDAEDSGDVAMEVVAVDPIAPESSGGLSWNGCKALLLSVMW
jgi:hypothetical protein